MWEDISRPSEREIEVVKESNVQYVKNKITYYNSVPWNAVDKKFIAELYKKLFYERRSVSTYSKLYIWKLCGNRLLDKTL